RTGTKRCRTHYPAVWTCSPGGACRRGNRRLNHAIHLAAITQIRHRHSDGRAYYDKKRAEGKTANEALRALKRRISDAVFACLRADAQAASALAKGPGGHLGNDADASAVGSHPECRLFGEATPGPSPTLRSRPVRRAETASHTREANSRTT